MSHQDRREPLPKGYQFGDAGKQLSISIRFSRQFDEKAFEEESLRRDAEEIRRWRSVISRWLH